MNHKQPTSTAVKTAEENNKLIAEFMGSKFINEPYKANKDDIELTCCLQRGSLFYKLVYRK